MTDAAQTPAQNQDELTPGHLDLGDEGWAGGAAWRSFARVFFVVAALGVAAAFAVNAVVDPMGLTGAGRFPLVTVEGASRAGKAARLQQLAEEPEVLLLGSSSARNFDPKTVEELSGRTAFNASMSAGRPADAFAMASLAAEHFVTDDDLRSRGEKAAGPHLVYFLDVDSALASNPPNAGLVTTADLRRQFGRMELGRMALETFTPYLQLSTLKLSAQSVRRYMRGERFSEASSESSIRVDGFRVKDPLRGGGVDNQARFNAETERYRLSIYGTGEPATLDRRARNHIERMVADANERGDTPTIVIMPVNPKAVEVLRPFGWDERYEAVRDFVTELGTRHELRLVDLHRAEDVGLSKRDYYDNVHTTTEASDRILGELAERSVFTER